MTPVLVGFVCGIALGIIISICLWILLPNVMEFFRVLAEKRQGYIEFREMPDPPDEGIDQLIYKPQGQPAVINKGVVGRRKKLRN